MVCVNFFLNISQILRIVTSIPFRLTCRDLRRRRDLFALASRSGDDRPQQVLD